MAVVKLAQRLRAHDWFAACIEVLVGSEGIRAAPKVRNWNKDRQERRVAAEYARQLHAELQSDLRNMVSTRKFWKKVSDYQAVASIHAETGALAEGSAWKTLLAYYQASQLRPFELEDTTFTELRYAGELRLLGDTGLSKGLADYYRQTGSGMIGEILRHAPVYRAEVRGLTPYAVQEYIWAKCWRQLAGADQELIDCPAPVSEDEAAKILQGYAGDPDLLKNLRFWRTQMHVSVLIVDDVERQGRELDTRVQTLLARAR